MYVSTAEITEENQCDESQYDGLRDVQPAPSTPARPTRPEIELNSVPQPPGRHYEGLQPAGRRYTTPHVETNDAQQPPRDHYEGLRHTRDAVRVPATDAAGYMIVTG